jgi:GDP-D-mannose 3', 5'-epimerase
VAGAGGMIGGALVERLVSDGHDVRAVDIKPETRWWRRFESADNWDLCDLRGPDEAAGAVSDAEWVFDLAETMGGISFIESERVECAESIEIGIHLLRESARAGVQRFFFSSSACIYPTHIQGTTDVVGLRESDAWPARPEDGYGFAKLYMEELCRHYGQERGLETRVARYHNIFGPYGSWNDGREKSPAALCRKVAEAKVSGSGEIEIWGDGEQRRSYCFVDDCVTGTLRLMTSSHFEPLNIGSDRLISVNELVSTIEGIAGVSLERRYVSTAAQGVRGRNSDNTLCKHVLDWEPRTSLEDGLSALYVWVEAQVLRALVSR